MDESLEDLLEKTAQQNKEQLESIREEWNRAVKEWPSALDEAGGVLNTSSDLTDSSDTEGNLHVTQETVQKCLHSCDNILLRNSTVIS